MADKFMFIPNDVIKNYPFYRLQLVVDSTKWKFYQVHKVVKPMNKILSYNFGD